MLDLPLTPQQLFIIGIVFILILLAAVVLPARQSSASPYKPIDSILTPAEQHFYKVLLSVTRERAIVTAKVRIADIVKVRRTIKKKHFWGHFSKISQKHIDFVLLDPTTFKTLCLIELDDKSHARFGRSQRDKFVNRVMSDAGIPLHRFAVRRRYDGREIEENLKTCYI